MTPTTVIDPALGAQHYRLEISPHGVTLSAGDEAGLSYGRQTFDQLVRDDGLVACLSIEDGPDLPVRGVMLDVSRDKVPTMETLRGLVERLAAWRVNHLQLYIEHTYAYEGFDEVWEGWSPFTAEEIRTLDAWCADHHIELVVQQNCLGHLERWLCHPRFAGLAAIPGGWRDDAGHHEPPSTLDPRLPGSWELVDELLRQQRALLPAARRLHVGLDEPLDLNPEIWQRLYAPEPYTADGVADIFRVPLPAEAQQLYVDWLRRIRSAPQLEGVELLVWADVVGENPAVRDAVPDGVTLVEWGYERYHPFDERCAALASLGRPFWVCAGTSGWSSIAGRPTNAAENIDRAAAAARRFGGGGLVVADWGDRGHTQQLPVAEPGFAYGAVRGWRCDADVSWDVVAARQVFGDAVTAAVARRLGDAYLRMRPQVPEASVLLTLLSSPDEFSALRDAGLDEAGLDAVSEELDEVERLLVSANPARPDAVVVLAELRHTLAWLRFAVDLGRHRLRALVSPDADWVASLSERRAQLLDEYRTRWLARNRPGGLEDSLQNLAATDPSRPVA